jgi:hypothetical protein
MATHSEDQPVIGLIGMGDMGRMYAKRLIAGGWTKYVVVNVGRGLHTSPFTLIDVDAILLIFLRIYACDRPEKYETLAAEFAGESFAFSRDA